MDLGAYKQIEDLSDLAIRNGIDVPRLRGYRLMSEEQPMTKEDYAELDHNVEIESAIVFTACFCKGHFYPKGIYRYNAAQRKREHEWIDKEKDCINWNVIHGMEKFWQIYEERLELCHRALHIRHEHLLGTPSDVAPILWQHGALARLGKGEVIDPLLYHGYSTISLGYAGLYECVYFMTGESHTGAGKDFALAVMQKLNDKCNEWKLAEDIDYSPYGTPIESTTYKFAKCLQKRFGIIEGVTDHNYITNSYHVNVREKIDAFSKLTIEAEFQRLSPGGAVSYVEVPNLQNNIWFKQSGEECD